jgi:DNA-binding transcriptional LysR family regulator
MSQILQIQTFIEVANAGSFAQASRQLDLPRTTVSARIKALETRLSTRLFNRNTRHVSLTNEGIDYLAACEQALQTLAGAEERLISTQQFKGRLKLSVPVALPKAELASLLVAFNKQYPDLHIEVLVTDEVADLVAENIDLALRGRDVTDQGLIARKLGSTALIYVGAHDLIDEQGMALSKDAPIQVLNNQLVFAPGAKASHTGFATASFSMAHALVCEGNGVAVLPENICRKELANGQLIQFNTTPSPELLPMYLVYSARNLAKRVRVLIDFIIDNYQVHGLV